MNNIDNYNNNQSACQINISVEEAEVLSWARRVEKLAGAFTANNRELFYREFAEASRGVATRVMKNWGYKGDIYHDAQDVASECTLLLLKQESKGTGLFKDEKRTPTQLRGYISKTIWDGCKQRIQPLVKKSPRFVSLEAMQGVNGFDVSALLDECLSTPDKRLALEEAVQKMQDDHRAYPKLPKGVTPMDCVLDDAVSKALLKKSVSARTLERYKKDIRETIALDLGMDLEYEKRLARRRRLADSRRQKERKRQPENPPLLAAA